MTRRFLLILAAFALAVGSVHASGPQFDQVIPLDKGKTWTYEGKVQWTVTDVTNSTHSNQVRIEAVRWTMRVVKKTVAGASAVAVVDGLPLQFAWDNPSASPGYAVIEENEDGVFVQGAVSEKEGEQLAQRALNGQRLGTQLLRFPVRVGECVGGEPRSPKTEYCWLVRRRVRQPQGSAWELGFYTLPDEELLYVIPGVGITRFLYNHHGTTMLVDVALVGSGHDAAM